jgi:hypothetical protein
LLTKRGNPVGIRPRDSFAIPSLWRQLNPFFIQWKFPAHPPAGPQIWALILGQNAAADALCRIEHFAVVTENQLGLFAGLAHKIPGKQNEGYSHLIHHPSHTNFGIDPCPCWPAWTAGTLGLWMAVGQPGNVVPGKAAATNVVESASALDRTRRHIDRVIPRSQLSSRSALCLKAFSPLLSHFTGAKVSTWRTADSQGRGGRAPAEQSLSRAFVLRGRAVKEIENRLKWLFAGTEVDGPKVKAI